MTTSFRILHAADIHLDSPLRGVEQYPDAPVSEVRGATRRAFDNLVDVAESEGARLVLIAGDLFDGDWRDYNTGLFFAARMGRLVRAGIRVVIVSGNHDAASQITKMLALPEGVRLLSARRPESIAFDDLGVVVHGQGYATRETRDNLAARYPLRESAYPVNIGLLHTALAGRPGHEPYAPCSVDDLRSRGYDYWALGHVHQREEVSRDPWMVFPGNLQGRNIRETGAKGATLVSVEDGAIVGLAHRDLDVLRWAHLSVDLTDCASGEEARERIRSGLAREYDGAGGRTLAARLVLCGRTSMHGELRRRAVHWREEAQAIAAALGGVWLEAMQVRTAPAVEERGPQPDAEGPLAALLRAVADIPAGRESLRRYASELADLEARLPADLFDSADPFLPEGDEEVAALRDEVRELLLARLSGERRET